MNTTRFFAAVLLMCTLAALVSGGAACGTMTLPQIDPVWEARARASCDDPKAARAVVLDAVYAGQATALALAYEKALDQRPSSLQRIASFGWAAMMAEKYRAQENDPIVSELAKRAVDAVKPLVYRDMSQNRSAQEYQDNLAFKPTKDAGIWLVWAHYLERFCFDKPNAEAAFDHVIALDPTIAEAYFDRAELATYPYDPDYFKRHLAESDRDLVKAEDLQPKLHILLLSDKWINAGTSGQNTKAMHCLRQYLKLWPNTPNKERMEAELAREEKAAGNKPG